MRLSLVLHGKDVFAMDNVASDVAVEFTDLTTKRNSALRPFPAVKLEWHDRQNLMLPSIEAIPIC